MIANTEMESLSFPQKIPNPYINSIPYSGPVMLLQLKISHRTFNIVHIYVQIADKNDEDLECC